MFDIFTTPPHKANRKSKRKHTEQATKNDIEKEINNKQTSSTVCSDQTPPDIPTSLTLETPTSLTLETPIKRQPSRRHLSRLDSCTEKSTIAHSCFSVPAHNTEHDEEDAEYELPLDVMSRLVQRTEKRVAEKMSKAPFLRKHTRLHKLPRLERADLQIGEMLGRGGFASVHEIVSFHTHGDFELLGGGSGDGAKRKFVIKHLLPELVKDPQRLVGAAKDLVMEAHFLSALRHDNILQLRGYAVAGIEGFVETLRADGFFLIYDRLDTTLTRMILHWKGLTNLERSGSSRTLTRLLNDTLLERFQVAIDIASAVEYLHRHRILYRDLKPSNIGFDQENRVKLFDFGLAVELPMDDDPEAMFDLAGNTGTARYMAYEVIRNQPYNCKADVFSFAILLWEILSLTKPYDGVQGAFVKDRVALHGERPPIPEHWPSGLQRLLRRGWAVSPLERPNMQTVWERLLYIKSTIEVKSAV